jgi:3',5'-cyclic-AMP phosphodiesterase
MSYSFVQITDHHLCESEAQLLHGYSPAYAFRQVLRHIAEHVAPQVDFLVTTGDLVEVATDEAYWHLAQMLQVQVVSPAPGPALITLEGLQAFPLYFLPGNHDDRTAFFHQLFAGTPHMPLMNVNFHHKGVQFICLDWGPQAKAMNRPELLTFLERCLQEGLPSVLLTHHHLVPVGCRWLDTFLPDETSAEAFWQIVTRYQAHVLGIFSGHAHVTYEQVVNGISVFGLRSTAPQFVLQDEPLFCLQPPHYRLVTIHGTLLTTKICEVPL